MNKDNLAPVAVFAYNRLSKIQKCICALEKCALASNTSLYIFADGYKSDKDKSDVETVHNWLRQYNSAHIKGLELGDGSSSFKSVTVVEKEHNCGLANSIISGVTNLLNEYGKVIVVEDDLIVSTGFLRYMNEGLDFYQNDAQIWAIASYGYDLKALRKYNHDIYLGYRASSWGWATWKDRWDTVDWEVKDYNELQHSKEMQRQFCRGGGDLYPMLQRQMRGESDSWAIRWNYAASKQNRLTVYPKVGLVSNDGFDGTGTHSGLHAPDAIIDQGLCDSYEVRFEKNKLDPRIVREFYLLHTDTFWKKVKRNLSMKDIIKLIKRVWN